MFMGNFVLYFVNRVLCRKKNYLKNGYFERIIRVCVILDVVFFYY